jgi:hypothetical protein
MERDSGDAGAGVILFTDKNDARLHGGFFVRKRYMQWFLSVQSTACSVAGYRISL